MNFRCAGVGDYKSEGVLVIAKIRQTQGSLQGVKWKDTDDMVLKCWNSDLSEMIALL